VLVSDNISNKAYGKNLRGIVNNSQTAPFDVFIVGDNFSLECEKVNTIYFFFNSSKLLNMKSLNLNNPFFAGRYHQLADILLPTLIIESVKTGGVQV
jgi:hypothetical protein